MVPIKTIYIYHDCFMVQTPDVTLIFDFWKDPYQRDALPNPLLDMDCDKPVYVFVSHGHKDHFNPQIFSWARYFKDIHYVVSRDVRKRINHLVSPTAKYNGDKVDESQVITLTDNDRYADRNINVATFPSTDIGNSYAVTVGGRTVFHAGDLNAWIWKDESTEEEVNAALDAYTRIIDKIAGTFSEFDLCFFPVDSRIGTDYFTGAKIFLERFRVKNFFPMHFELGEKSAEIARLHRDAAKFDLYSSPTCHHYIMSAPYSAYFILT